MTQWQLKTPVVLIIFNRPDTTERVFEAIRQARPPQLLVIADGPRTNRPGEVDRCAAARQIVDRVDWDCQVLKNYSEVNLGCRKRVSSGLDWVFNTVEEAIVLEDDCLPHPSFFRFCEELLEKYRHEDKVMAISGNNFQFGQRRTPYSYYFSQYTHIWGWASWRRAWQHYDLSMSQWPKMQASGWLQKKLQYPEVVRHWSQIFQLAYRGFDTWDYAWLFTCWLHNGLSILPEVNLVTNIGFGEDATHTKSSSKLANIPVEAIKTPLKHPPSLDINHLADRFTEIYIFGIQETQQNRSRYSIQPVQNQVVSQNSNNSMNVQVLSNQLAILQANLSQMQEALGRIEKRQLQALNTTNLRDNEFKVYSQWGEDGIIQFLIDRVYVKNKLFVEFGVENYLESNTRFLLRQNNWSGLVIDGSEHHVNYIKNDSIYWRHNLKAVRAFVTKDNINHLIIGNGIQGEIGLLSIDIDGNDYWVWKEIDVINPAIVVIEYNYRFGKDRAVTIPYTENFVRSQAHYSMIYYGASLRALWLLGQKKGYSFVGCNSAGNNAFFVRKDLKPDSIPELTVEEGYVAGLFREARNEQGRLAYLSWQEEQNILQKLPVVDISEFSSNLNSGDKSIF